MPYCIECGVHVSESAKFCPLCQTEIIRPHPHGEESSKEKSELPVEVVQDKFDRALWMKLVSITLIMPAVISLLINWLFQRAITWSAYVAASLLFVWVWSISPFLSRDRKLFKWIPINLISILGFLYVIEYLSGSNGWFLTIGLPVTFSFFILFTSLTILFTNKLLRELHKASAVITSIGLLCVAINAAVSLYTQDAIRLDWSLIVFTTCIAFALIGIVLQQRPYIVESIKHYFHL